MIILLRKEEHAPLDINPMTDQSLSRLMSLPAELRNTIWSYLLIQCQSASARSSLQNPVSKRSPREARFCANILGTCKQAYAEGTPILYGENTFRAHQDLLTSLPSFLICVRPSRIILPPVKHTRMHTFIRRYFIHVRLDTDPRYNRSQVEHAFSGIDELEIEVFQSMYDSCDYSNLSLFENVRGVKKVIIQGSIGDGEYARWLASTMMLPPSSSTTDPRESSFDHKSQPGTYSNQENLDDIQHFLQRYRPSATIEQWHPWEQGNR